LTSLRERAADELTAASAAAAAAGAAAASAALNPSSQGAIETNSDSPSISQSINLLLYGSSKAGLHSHTNN